MQLVKGSIAGTNRLETKRSVSIIHHHNRCKLSITMGWSNIDGYSWQTRPPQQHNECLTVPYPVVVDVLPCLACNTLAQSRRLSPSCRLLRHVSRQSRIQSTPSSNLSSSSGNSAKDSLAKCNLVSCLFDIESHIASASPSP